MSLERVIAEQQQRIDHMEALEASRTKGWQAEFKRLEALLGAAAYFMHVADGTTRSTECSESGHERYRKARQRLREAAAEAGFCWHCETLPCVCSDCECED